jgi:hypothetical protein
MRVGTPTMAVHGRDVEIQRPCPVALDPRRADGGVRSWYCGHCEKSVHVLSNMTEREARALLAAREGQAMCVTYAVRADGSIRFAPEPEATPTPATTIVPVAALTRRRRRAALGLGVALAACTPHDNADVQSPRIQVHEPTVRSTTSVIPVTTSPPRGGGEPIEDVAVAMFDGEDAPRPEPVRDETLVDGGIGRPMPPPSNPKLANDPRPSEASPTTRPARPRGGVMARRPPPPSPD